MASPICPITAAAGLLSILGFRVARHWLANAAEDDLDVGPPRRTAVASAPGKVLLTGGYLVLDKKYPGLVVGTEARFFTSAAIHQRKPATVQKQHRATSSQSSSSSSSSVSSAAAVRLTETQAHRLTHVGFPLSRRPYQWSSRRLATHVKLGGPIMSYVAPALLMPTLSTGPMLSIWSMISYDFGPSGSSALRGA